MRRVHQFGNHRNTGQMHPRFTCPMTVLRIATWNLERPAGQGSARISRLLTGKDNGTGTHNIGAAARRAVQSRDGPPPLSGGIRCPPPAAIPRGPPPAPGGQPARPRLVAGGRGRRRVVLAPGPAGLHHRHQPREPELGEREPGPPGGVRGDGSILDHDQHESLALCG